MIHKFFSLQDAHLYSRGWPYAPTIYPLSEEIIVDCPECGTVGRYPSKELSLDLELGTKYPDILMSGDWPLLIISEKVVVDWQNAGVTGFEYYSVKINKIKSKRLLEITPPQYYHIVVTGRCELDLEKMGLEIIKRCSRCGRVVNYNKKDWELGKTYIKESTWDGKDLFISELFSAVNFCTEQVIMTACKNKHTSFRFIDLEDALQINPIPESINYLKYCK